MKILFPLIHQIVFKLACEEGQMELHTIIEIILGEYVINMLNLIGNGPGYIEAMVKAKYQEALQAYEAPSAAEDK